MARSPAQVDTHGLPPIPVWLRNLLIGLAGLYLVEILVWNLVGNALYEWFAWTDLIARPWQIVTRYALQGPGSASVMRVVFDLFLLYFLAPPVVAAFDQRQKSQILAAGVIGGTVFAGLLGAIGFAVPPAFGWHGLPILALTLFGLLNPDAIIRWNFVFPIPGKVITWGTGIVSAVIVLAEHTMANADALGVWLGAIGWWFLLGPGGRRRQLLNQGRKIERELNKLKVLPGGKDETVH